MKNLISALAFCVAFLPPPLHAETVRIPFIVLACKLDPYLPPVTLEHGIFSGYDCIQKNGVRHGIAEIESDLDPNSIEYLYRLNEQLRPAAEAAERACGRDCRFFYTTIGNQCMTVAQARLTTGLGSFVSGATTQAEAEALAIRNCNRYVGTPGQSCRIVVSQCVQSDSWGGQNE